jgi:hypothetical protein
MRRHEASLAAKQSAVTRRTPTSSKQSLISARTASGPVHDPGLRPRVLDPQHQVADHRAVQLDDEGLRETAGLHEPGAGPAHSGRARDTVMLVWVVT